MSLSHFHRRGKTNYKKNATELRFPTTLFQLISESCIFRHDSETQSDDAANIFYMAHTSETSLTEFKRNNQSTCKPNMRLRSAKNLIFLKKHKHSSYQHSKKNIKCYRSIDSLRSFTVNGCAFGGFDAAAHFVIRIAVPKEYSRPIRR